MALSAYHEAWHAVANDGGDGDVVAAEIVTHTKQNDACVRAIAWLDGLKPAETFQANALVHYRADLVSMQAGLQATLKSLKGG